MAEGKELLTFDAAPLAPPLAELDALRTQLDARGPLVIGWEGQLRRDLQTEAVHASVSMEGVPVTVEEVRRILAGDRPTTVTPEDADLVEGYRDAMLYVQARADDPVFDWSPELIKAIHHRILAGRRDAGRYGRDRVVANDQTSELIYTPPQENVDRWVRTLCARMNGWDSGSGPHPAIRAAWVHVALAAVHPFGDGNGRTARVLASLAMYRGGFQRPEFCSLEEWWGRYRQDYYDAFRCLSAIFDPNTDVTPFIRAHVEAQRSQVRALALREETNRQLWIALGRVCASVAIPDRAAFALWDAYNGREITRPYYRAITDMSDASTTLDFSTLRAAGLLAAEGRTRGRKYVAGNRLFPLIAQELGILNAETAERDTIIRELTRRVSQQTTAPAPTRSTVLFPEYPQVPPKNVTYPRSPATSTTTSEPS